MTTAFTAIPIKMTTSTMRFLGDGMADQRGALLVEQLDEALLLLDEGVEL